MSEWKEFKADNLSECPDMLVKGKYEWQYFDIVSDIWRDSGREGMDILQSTKYCDVMHRYRKPEPLPPTHEELEIHIHKIDKRKVYFTISNMRQKNSDQVSCILNGTDITPQKIIDTFSVELDPKTHTHKEIMSLFWKTNQGAWIKPMGYFGGNYMLVNATFNTPVVTQDKYWFTNRESAVIPPEAE